MRQSRGGGSGAGGVRRMVCVAVVVVAAGLAVSCDGGAVSGRGLDEEQPAPFPGRGDSDPEPVITRGIVVSGGVSGYRHARDVEAEAVLVLHGEDGARSLTYHRMVLDIPGGVVRSVWRTTQGRAGDLERATVRAGDPAEQSDPVRQALAVLAHRIRGPLNLLDSGVKPGQPTKRQVGEVDCVRVPVAGRNARATAYYFDVTTGLLRFVEAESGPAGRGPTVTVYDYEDATGSLMLPRRLRLVRRGELNLVGETPLLEVELTNVRSR